MPDDPPATDYLGDILRNLRDEVTALTNALGTLTMDYDTIKLARKSDTAQLEEQKARTAALLRQLNSATLKLRIANNALQARGDDLAALTSYLDSIGVPAATTPLERVRYIVGRASEVARAYEALRREAQTKPLNAPTDRNPTPPTMRAVGRDL